MPCAQALKNKPSKRKPKKGPDPERVEVEEALAALPAFEEKPVRLAVV
jgi:hypothetical protein